MTEAVADREQQILGHLELVQFIVNRLSFELPSCVEREDLVSTGILGLIKAVDRYDSGRGVKFETYASCLIRGEIRESLRERDRASRSLRRKGRDISRTSNELAVAFGRQPLAEEIAQTLGITVQEYQTTLRQLETANEVSLEESVENDPQVEARDLTTPEGVGPGASDPAIAYEHRAFLAVVTEGLELLPEREQAVLALYYGDDLTLREIGTLFGITESRVCQLHAQALRRLKSALAHDLDLAA